MIGVNDLIDGRAPNEIADDINKIIETPAVIESFRSFRHDDVWKALAYQ